MLADRKREITVPILKELNQWRKEWLQQIFFFLSLLSCHLCSHFDRLSQKAVF